MPTSVTWRKREADYATIAMPYEGMEMMRDRTTGAVIESDGHPSITIQPWTRARCGGGNW